MKTIIYLRTSTVEQNPMNQLKDCKTLINCEYEVIEEKQSAYKDKKRPLFDSIKVRIKSGEVKELVVWAWDRLYRDRKKFIEFFKFCEIYDCKIHSFNQKYFEDFYKIPKPFDEIVSNIILNLLGHQAEEESRLKGERVKLAVRRKKGQRTKSYNGKLWGRKRKINQKLIDEVLKLSQDGLSVREIAQSVWFWDSNKNQKFISKSSVQKILTDHKIKSKVTSS
jgi:DNA invertase Pin-like site-specific DNA recombinase